MSAKPGKFAASFAPLTVAFDFPGRAGTKYAREFASRLPRGTKRCWGIPFRLAAKGKRANVLRLAKGRKTAIDAGGRAATHVCFLHYWEGKFDPKEKTQVGDVLAMYRLVYADGQSADVPVRFLYEVGFLNWPWGFHPFNSVRMNDMRTLDFDGQFDAAFNWQGSFGFFSDSENLDVLVRMARAVRPGGRVLIDQPNREYILRHFRTSNRHTTVRSRTRWNRRSQRAETWFVDNATGESWSMSIRLYTVSQFRKLFAAAGLTLVGTCGDLNGGPYSRSSRRIYVVGSRSIHEHPTVLS